MKVFTFFFIWYMIIEKVMGSEYMKIDLLMQSDEKNKISEKIVEAFAEKPKKAYFFLGTVKDTGFRILEEEIIDSKTKLYFAMGIDKKNTTRVMLEDLLMYTKDVYFYSNNHQIEFDANLMIFEYTDEVRIYQLSGNISESDLVDNLSIYTEMKLNLKLEEEEKEYKSILKLLLKQVEECKFEILTKEKIEKLVEEKEIFTTRQYVHNVKSIAELLNTKEENGDNMAEEKKESNVEIPKLDLSDIELDIDIDLPEETAVVEIPEEEETEAINGDAIDVEFNEKEQVKEEKLKDMISEDQDFIDQDNELYDETLENVTCDLNETIDINHMLFSKADMKLDMDDLEESESEETDSDQNDEILQVKKINLNTISNYIYELPSKNVKGQEANSLKIPNYIVNMIPEFFEIAEKGKNRTIDGNDYKVREIKVEIVDAANNQKYTDREAKMTLKKGQSFMLLVSDKLKDISYEEKDIARIIKLASDIYHIEIISSQMQEYKLWDKVCTQKFKSTDRMYGMM